MSGSRRARAAIIRRRANRVINRMGAPGNSRIDRERGDPSYVDGITVGKVTMYDDDPPSITAQPTHGPGEGIGGDAVAERRGLL